MSEKPFAQMRPTCCRLIRLISALISRRSGGGSWRPLGSWGHASRSMRKGAAHTTPQSVTGSICVCAHGFQVQALPESSLTEWYNVAERPTRAQANFSLRRTTAGSRILTSLDALNAHSLTQDLLHAASSGR